MKVHSRKEAKKCIYEALLHLHELLMAKAPKPLGDYLVIKDGSLLCNKSSTVVRINNQSQREGDYKEKYNLIYVLLGAGWCGDLLLFLAQEHRLSKQPRVCTARFKGRELSPARTHCWRSRILTGQGEKVVGARLSTHPYLKGSCLEWRERACRAF